MRRKTVVSAESYAWTAYGDVALPAGSAMALIGIPVILFILLQRP